ncbi:SDR family NAD(P)-dependent oxidoreductase [Halalkalicoccus subterraneus]|uniref:SDR family NAD(P)-dependent oxidoreductase n=1 Tax=Halalkalicoccus subterraneus TaxID=2675002 RepID=UPI000EFB4776|nr:SDR family NAD(P)-dependent oxidoreductase [Halalkalicoccus subterraneus]
MDIDRHASLDGQVALVTGATRGIGRSIAIGLGSLGATVYAGARNIDDVDAEGQRAIELDVTDDGTMRAAIDRIDEEASRLDVLVNNAGVAGSEAPLHEAEVEGIDATFGVNLRGPVVLTRFALPHLLKRPGGRVVNVSSGMGALGEGMSGGHPPYRVSKAGLNGLTVYLHGEYGDEGLLANAACPGWIRTDLGSAAAPRSPEEGADTPVWLATFESGSPAGRFWRDRERIDW